MRANLRAYMTNFPLKRLLALGFAGVQIAMVCTSGAATFSTTAFSDAFVATGPTGNLSNNNYGGGGALGLAAPNLPLGEFQTVLQFNLTSVRNSLDAQYGAGSWTVQSISLQLTASPHNNAIYNEIAPGQFNASLMQNNSWVEGTGTAGTPAANGITFNTLQGTYINNALDQPLGTFSFGGTTSGANSYSLDLSPGLLFDVLNGSDLTIRLYAADDEVSYLFTSRANGSSAARPTLIVNAIPEPSSLTLYGLGLATLLFWRRKKATGPERSACVG